MTYRISFVFFILINCFDVFCKDNLGVDISLPEENNSIDEVLNEEKTSDVKNISNNDSLNEDNVFPDVEVDDEKNKYTGNTMYRQLYDNIELSDEERKMIKIEEEERSFKKTDAKYVTFYDIKYSSLKWKDIKNVNIVSADLFSRMQRNFYTYQNLGIDGSNTFSLVPKKIVDIGTSFGYNGFDVYKVPDEDLVFFDTKMPLGDLRVSFDLDSGTGFFFKLNTYISANKNFHFGVSIDSVLRQRVLSAINKNKFNLAVVNFPISTYFLYKSTDERFLGLVNFNIGNYIFSDHGGTYTDGNVNYIDENDVQDVFDVIIRKKYMDIGLICYLQYKTKFPYIYFQYKFKYETNKTEINNELENVKDEVTDKMVTKLVDKKISEKVFGYVSEKKIDGDHYSILNSDNYIENSFELGVKDIVEIRRRLEFSYNLFYIFKFATRSTKGKDYSKRELESVTNNSIISRKWYFDPFSFGANLDFIGIRISPLLTFSEKKLYFKILLGYKMKYFAFDVMFVRSKIPLIYTEYGFLNDKFRYYKKDYDKIPLDLFFDISGNINIKGIVEIYPRILFSFSWNKMYFTYLSNHSDKYISKPSQNENVLFHMYPTINFKVMFLKYFNIELLPMLNFKKILGSNIDNELNENTNNIPLFSIYLKTYYHRNFIRHNVELCTGLEFFWRTNYYPNNFDSVTQQFFKQPIIEDNKSEFKVVYKPKINVFFNFRFGNFVGSIKVNLINIFWNAHSFASKYYPNNNDYYMFSIQYLMF